MAGFGQKKWALPGFKMGFTKSLRTKVGFWPKKVGFCPVLKKKWPEKIVKIWSKNG